MDEGFDALSEKEKETLRLILRGHDAKSMARELSLSVHTINDRLRAARRKLGVTSSKEAARLVHEREGETRQFLADKDLGDASGDTGADPSPIATGVRRWTPWIGVMIIMLTIVIIAALTLDTAQSDRPVGDPATPIENVQLDTFEATAREWLEIVDTFDWDASFSAAGRPFRDPNTAETWRDASLQVRVPLGAAIEREVQTIGLVQRDSAHKDAKDQVRVEFLTQFQNRADVREQVTLEQEHGEWKVMGYVIE